MTVDHSQLSDSATDHDESIVTSTAQLPDSAPGRWVNGVWTRLPDNVSHSARAVKQIIIAPMVQYLIFGSIFAVAVAMRLVDLDGQAVHHDESLHGFFAWKISTGGEYAHSPLMHGMFLFEIVAATFVLFGDSEFTLRLSMALFGSGLVLIPMLLRKELSVPGAIAASLMLAFSPALFYFSRFARNDIYMAVFALLLVVAIFRYMDGRRAVWLYVAAAVMALAMSTKETAYMLIAVFGLYLAYRSRDEIISVILGYKSFREIGKPGEILAMMAGIALPFAAPMISVFQGFIGITLSAPNNTPNVATGAPDGLVATLIALFFTVLLFSAGAVAGAMTLGRRFFMALLIFWAVYALVMTNMGTSLSGIPTGVWQSLGYWLAQQEVNRGDQLWHYYFMLVSIYEFLPVLASIGFVVYYVLRSGRASIGLALTGIVALLIALVLFFAVYFRPERTPVADASPIPLLALLSVGIVALLWMSMRLRVSRFTQFLVFWCLSTFAVYSFAGEMMPWLLVNVTLPFVILAGKAIGELIQFVDWHRLISNRGWLMFPLLPLFLVVLWRLAIFDLGSDLNLSDTSDLLKFLELWGLILLLGILLLSFYQYASAHGFKQASSILGLSMAALMFLFTVKASAVAVYVNGDVPREMLVYTQTTPDLHETAREIEVAKLLVWDQKLDKLSGSDEFNELDQNGHSVAPPGLSIAIDTLDGYAWPWSWYLRNYDSGVSYVALDGENASVSPRNTVLVVNDKNKDSVEAVLPDHFGEGRYMIHRWWFPEGYKLVTLAQFFDALTDRSQWRKPVDYWLYRKLPTPIGYQGSYVYFSDYLPKAPLR